MFPFCILIGIRNKKLKQNIRKTSRRPFANFLTHAFEKIIFSTEKIVVVYADFKIEKKKNLGNEQGKFKIFCLALQ